MILIRFVNIVYFSKQKNLEFKYIDHNVKVFWKNYETHVSGNILSSGNLSLREKCIFPHSD